MKIPGNTKLLPFAKSVITGDHIRDVIAEHLLHHGAGIWMDPQTASCDFQMVYNNNVFRVEIKDESNQAHTGNVCIETSQGKENWPSGIIISEATVAIHYFGDYCFLYRNKHMLNWIYDQVDIRTGVYGDNNNKCYLVPITSIKSLRWACYTRMDKLWRSSLFTF